MTILSCPILCVSPEALYYLCNIACIYSAVHSEICPTVTLPFSGLVPTLMTVPVLLYSLTFYIENCMFC